MNDPKSDHAVELSELETKLSRLREICTKQKAMGPEELEERMPCSDTEERKV